MYVLGIVMNISLRQEIRDGRRICYIDENNDILIYLISSSGDSVSNVLFEYEIHHRQDKATYFVRRERETVNEQTQYYFTVAKQSHEQIQPEEDEFYRNVLRKLCEYGVRKTKAIQITYDY